MKQPSRSNKFVALFLGVASFALGAAFSSLAAPPSSPYTPGETLNPSCSPGDANCTVVSPPAGTGAAGLLTYWTATSTVSSSLSLFWDNPNIRLGIGTSQPSSTLHIIAGTTGATTLQLMGVPNQTGNLLTVSSSSGQRYFTISSLGLASSTEFRTPSSTIDTLTLTGNGLFSGSNISIAPNTTSTSLVFLQGTQVASTTLLAMGVAGQTANLLSLASSNGVRFFEVTNAGVASSSFFIAVNASTTRLDVSGSSTLKDFTFTSASSTGNITIGGTLQSNAGQTTLGSVSSTNLFASGYGFLTKLLSSSLGIGTNATSTALALFQTQSVASTTLLIQATSSQTGDLFTVSSSTGLPVFFNINSIGQIGIATTTYPSSSTLLTIASSSQIFNISAGGNIMIGTSTAPNGALLTIATTSNIFTILSTGNVGIGTTGPDSQLSVLQGALIDQSGDANIADSIGSNAALKTQALRFGETGTGEAIFSNRASGSSNRYGLSFMAGLATRLAITNAGNVGIGTASPGALLHVAGNGIMQLGNPAVTHGTINSANNLYINIDSDNNESADAFIIAHNVATPQAGSELFNLAEDGSATFTSSIAAASGNSVTFNNSNASPQGIKVNYTGAAPNNTGAYFIFGVDTGATRFQLRSNGGLANYQANNVDLSDERTKNLFGDAPSEIEKFSSLKFVLAEYKDNPLTVKDVMLIAQQVQTVYPELVTMFDAEKGLLGIREGALALRAYKVIQELTDRTASLSFRVEDLEHILASSSSASATSNQSSGTETMVSAVVAQFQNAYDIIFDKGLLKVAHLITDLIETKDIKIQNGVTTNDTITGEEYCISVVGGQLGAAKGHCASASISTEESSTSATTTATSTTEETSTSTSETAP